MILHSVTVGSGRPIAFVHGFTQTHRAWLPMVEMLHTQVSAQLIDAPGHGGSTDGARSLEQAGTDIIETIRPGVLVGYSMGARMCLHAALSDNTRVKGLVLISGTAGIEDPHERDLRVMSDTGLAERVERDGVAMFLDHWLSLPMFASLQDNSHDKAERLENTAAGLAASLRHAGTGTQRPLWNRLGELTMPVLVIAGSLDIKFTALARRMHASIPDSTLAILPTGHSVPLEAPADCAATIDSWLQSIATN